MKYRSPYYLITFCLALISCREILPPGVVSPAVVPFRLSPSDHFIYDNWKLDNFGSKIQSSYFRNTWTVRDTGRSILGWTKVSVLIDSTFDAANHYVRKDSLFFRFTDDGDVYQYSFMKNLIADRETLMLASRWDRIAAFSQPGTNSWDIMRVDSSAGSRTNETVTGRISSATDYIGTTINGVPRAVLSYRIEITKSRLAYTYWLMNSPTAILKVRDDSSILRNATLRELISMQVR